jgi:hypothetical protein
MPDTQIPAEAVSNELEFFPDNKYIRLKKPKNKFKLSCCQRIV